MPISRAPERWTSRPTTVLSVNNASHQAVIAKAGSRKPSASASCTSCIVSWCRGVADRSRVCPRIGLVAFASSPHPASGGASLVPLPLSLLRLQWMVRSRRADTGVTATPRGLTCVRTALHGGSPTGSGDRQILRSANEVSNSGKLHKFEAVSAGRARANS
jgi:hypothetical protein